MQSEDRESSLRTGSVQSQDRGCSLRQGVQSEDRECSLRIGSAI